MKTAQLVFSLVAVTLVVVVFTLGYTGALHPFLARAFFALVVGVWVFLALLTYHNK